MAENVQPNDESRRTFLKSIGVTGAATAGLGSLSDTAAAKSTSTTTKNSMKKLDLNADDLVPANKLLSLNIADVALDKVQSMQVLLDGTPVSNAQTLGSDTVILSVFDLLTNLNLKSQDTVPVKVQGVTKDGSKFVAEDVMNVVDPTNVLGGVTGTVTKTIDADGTVSQTTKTATGTVDSLSILSDSSSKSQQQMY